MMKRTNKIIKVSEDAPFALKIGTVNKDNPHVFFVNGHSWAVPTCEDDFNKTMNEINKVFKKEVSRFLGKFPILENSYILNFESTPNYMKKGKKTFVNFEVYFRQRNVNKTIFELRDTLSESLVYLGSKLEDSFANSSFILSKKK